MLAGAAGALAALDDEPSSLELEGVAGACVVVWVWAVPVVVCVAWAFDWLATAIVTAPVSPAAAIAIPRLVRLIRFSPRSRRVRGVLRMQTASAATHRAGSGSRETFVIV